MSICEKFIREPVNAVSHGAGAVIYALKRPNPFPRILGFHEIWHGFVILGSAAHFWLSFKYLMYI
nr:hemolysin III family protein [uncultured Desulfobacter sp.]